MALVAAVVSFCVLFSAPLVSGYCDENVSTKIQQCIFASPLLDMQKSLNDETKIIKYCSSTMNEIVNCMERPIKDCADSPKEKKLLELIVDVDALRGGLQYLCDNINVIKQKETCLEKISSPVTQQCMLDSVGVITNAGQPGTIKEGLDLICRLCVYEVLHHSQQSSSHIMPAWVLWWEEERSTQKKNLQGWPGTRQTTSQADWGLNPLVIGLCAIQRELVIFTVRKIMLFHWKSC